MDMDKVVINAGEKKFRLCPGKDDEKIMDVLKLMKYFDVFDLGIDLVPNEDEWWLYDIDTILKQGYMTWHDVVGIPRWQDAELFPDWAALPEELTIVISNDLTIDDIAAALRLEPSQAYEPQEKYIGWLISFLENEQNA